MIHRLINNSKLNTFFVRSLILALIISECFFIFSSPARAAINQQINYQGKLTNSSNVTVADGTYNMSFSLYTVSSGGSAIWTEARTGGNKVTVTSGLFSVMLGSVTPLTGINFNQTLYLGVTIESDPEMTPRKILGTVPAAFEALSFGGATSTQYLRADQAGTLIASSTQTALAITQTGSGKVFSAGNNSSTFLSVLNNGNVGIGTASPGVALDVVGNTNSSLVARIYNSNSGSGGYSTLELGNDSSSFQGQIFVTSSGNTNYAGANGLNIYNTGNNPIGLETNNLVRVFIKGDGSVGIGTTTPGSLLTVGGPILAGYVTATSSTASTFAAIKGTSNNTNNAIDVNNRSLLNTSGVGTLIWGTEELDHAGAAVLDWSAQQLFAAGNLSLDWSNRTLNRSNGSAFVYWGNGSLGVGSSTPSARLSVKGAGTGTGLTFQTTDSSDVPRFTVLDNGNVGIGTSTPGFGLTVAGTSNFTNALNFNGDAGTSGYVLQSTGSASAPSWVATSTLGISGGTNYFTLGSGFVRTSTSTDAVQAAYFTATSTTATSTFAGSLSVGNSSVLANPSTNSVALGSAVFGTITSSGNGSLAFGTSNTISGTGAYQISSTGNGSLALGSINGVLGANPLAITSTGAGSFAGGSLNLRGTGSINATANGSFAFGTIATNQNTVSITASGVGAFALGNATGNITNNSITASGAGSFAMGNSTVTGGITASGAGSVAWGQNISATGTLSMAFGKAFANTTDNTFQVGYSSTPTLTVNSTAVGIATTTPGFGLTVAGTSNFTNAMNFNGNAGTSGWILQSSGSGSAPAWVATSTLGVQAAGNYITALTGDATASGPGSTALTLATVNSNVGTFRSVTVNAKGLVTAATNPTTFSGYGISDTSANLAAALTDETGTGKAVFATTPTFTTNITTPLIIGGTTNASTLVLKTTTASGISGADIIFDVGNNGATEAMRIQNNGNIGIGTSGVSNKLFVEGDVGINGNSVDALHIYSADQTPYSIVINNNTYGSSDGDAFGFWQGDDGAGNIDVAGATSLKLAVGGQIYANSNLGSENSFFDPYYPVCFDANTNEIVQNVGASDCNFSSQRFKNNIATSTAGLDELMQLRPVSFSLNASSSNNHHLGLIAEEVVRVDPRLVFYNGDGQIQGVRYDEFTSVLAKSVQELNQKVDQNASSTASTTAALASLDLRVKSLESLNLGGGGNATLVIQGGGLGDGIMTALQSFGSEITDGISYLKNVFAEHFTTQNLTIKGKDVTKTGFTIYDRATGQPICVYFENGVMQNSAGDCPDSTATSTDQVVINTPPVPDNPPAPDATSTIAADTGTSTEPTPAPVTPPTDDPVVAPAPIDVPAPVISAPIISSADAPVVTQ